MVIKRTGGGRRRRAHEATNGLQSSSWAPALPQDSSAHQPVLHASVPDYVLDVSSRKHGMSREAILRQAATSESGLANRKQAACLVALSAQTGSCSVCNEPTLACRMHNVPG